MSKWIPVCKDCGTMNLVVDAWVVWDTVADQWVIYGLRGEGDSPRSPALFLKTSLAIGFSLHVS